MNNLRQFLSIIGAAVGSRSTGLLTASAVLGALWAVLIPSLAIVSPVSAGVFMFADSGNPDSITHPPHYTGRGGKIIVTVGLSERLRNHLEQLSIPVQNAIDTWNYLIPTVRNILPAGRSNVKSEHIDFESVLLHELGHCIGLGHPHFDQESNVPTWNSDFTRSTAGANGRYDFNAGQDGVAGSADDQRGDDINLHWFNTDNNPFQLAPIVDRFTYSRHLSDLPPGHWFAANGNQEVARLLGLPNTEAVMHQGIATGEARRQLSADDVATLRLAMSGFDGRARTKDDYTVTLIFDPFAKSDITLDIDRNQTALAQCRVIATEVRSGQYVIDHGKIIFNDEINWFFNPERAVFQPQLAITANGQSGAATLNQQDQLRLEISLQVPAVYQHVHAAYWLRAETPMGDLWLNPQLEFVTATGPAYTGLPIPLERFPVFEIPVSALPSGEYRLTFAVSGAQSGFPAEDLQATVNITLLP